MDVIPKYEFRKIVARHKGNYRVHKFTCWTQFLCLCFGQLTFRESLRDLTTTLNVLGQRRYHMGIRTDVARKTLSRANANSPWQIYYELAMVLVEQALRIHEEDRDLDTIAESIYALDSITIDLCLSLFPWAEFREHKAACY